MMPLVKCQIYSNHSCPKFRADRKAPRFHWRSSVRFSPFFERTVRAETLAFGTGVFQRVERNESRMYLYMYMYMLLLHIHIPIEL